MKSFIKSKFKIFPDFVLPRLSGHCSCLSKSKTQNSQIFHRLIFALAHRWLTAKVCLTFQGYTNTKNRSKDFFIKNLISRSRVISS